MPRLSDTMTEGKVAKWHKNVGDDVKKVIFLQKLKQIKRFKILNQNLKERFFTKEFQKETQQMLMKF